MESRRLDHDPGPGVPEALPRTLRMLAARLGPETLDRIWIFPPRVRGRREHGLVAASRFPVVVPEEDPDTDAGGGGPGGERRCLYTASYIAERTGRGLVLDHALREEGEAPPDRLPRVMEGVVRRSGDDLGEPREVILEGDPALFEELMSELDSDQLEEYGQSP